ncbi:hypothetical protein B0H13DRAFT_1886405 [Mycena leptocephala]|nr:hypothetical protein B0H13DRAFT_1886405 [Mycena leptocephala]
MLFRPALLALFALAHALSSSALAPTRILRRTPADASGIPCGCFGDPRSAFRARPASPVLEVQHEERAALISRGLNIGRLLWLKLLFLPAKMSFEQRTVPTAIHQVAETPTTCKFETAELEKNERKNEDSVLTKFYIVGSSFSSKSNAPIRLAHLPPIIPPKQQFTGMSLSPRIHGSV